MKQYAHVKRSEREKCARLSTQEHHRESPTNPQEPGLFGSVGWYPTAKGFKFLF